MRRIAFACVLILIWIAILGMSRGDVSAPVSDPELEVTFLGTGAAWPVPRLGCACDTCGAARTDSPRTRRLRSSLKIGRSPFLLVDFGMDIYHQLVPLSDPRPLAALLTHTHLDHAGGATDLHPLDRKGPIPLLTSPSVWGELKSRSPWADGTFAFRDGSTPQRVGPYTVRTFPLEHGTTAVGFRVEVGGRVLAYVCDVDRVPEGSLASLCDVDLMILDGTTAVDERPGDVHAHRHIGPDAIRALLAATRPDRVIFTHIGHGAPRHERSAARAKELYGAEVAHDGLVLGL